MCAGESKPFEGDAREIEKKDMGLRGTSAGDYVDCAGGASVPALPAGGGCTKKGLITEITECTKFRLQMPGIRCQR